MQQMTNDEGRVAIGQSDDSMLVHYPYKLCRSMGHAWKPTDVDRSPAFGIYVWFECDRCTMLRKDTLNILGMVAARSYKQPEGYRDPDHDRTDFRRAMVEELLALADEGRTLDQGHDRTEHESS